MPYRNPTSFLLAAGLATTFSTACTNHQVKTANYGGMLKGTGDVIEVAAFDGEFYVRPGQIAHAIGEVPCSEFINITDMTGREHFVMQRLAEAFEKQGLSINPSPENQHIRGFDEAISDLTTECSRGRSPN